MLKNTIQESFKQLITNRYLTTLAIITTLLAIGLAIYIGFSVQPRDLQQITHATVYGVTHLYSDHWYYLISFALFGIVAAMIHVFLSIKLYVTKGHPLALFMGYLGIGIILFAWVTAWNIINILTSV